MRTLVARNQLPAKSKREHGPVAKAGAAALAGVLAIGLIAGVNELSTTQGEKLNDQAQSAADNFADKILLAGQAVDATGGRFTEDIDENGGLRVSVIIKAPLGDNAPQLINGSAHGEYVTRLGYEGEFTDPDKLNRIAIDAVAASDSSTKGAEAASFSMAKADDGSWNVEASSELWKQSGAFGDSVNTGNVLTVDQLDVVTGFGQQLLEDAQAAKPITFRAQPQL